MTLKHSYCRTPLNIILFQGTIIEKNKLDSDLCTAIFSLGFTPCKAELPLQGRVLEGDETQKD